MDSFDYITCEEYYAEDDDRSVWMDELEIEFVNEELREIADEQKAAQVEVEADTFYFGA